MVERDYAFHRDPANLLGSFSSNFYDTYYRPLHRISFVLDAQLGGDDPAAYHRSNALLHALACMTLFGALLALGYPGGAALGAASVFAVHPALASAVAWIPGRDNILLAILLLASLLAWSRYLGEGRPARAGAWLALHWGLCMAAFLTKEAALAFPAVALAFALLWNGRPSPGRLALGALGWLGGWAGFLALRSRVLPLDADLRALGLDAALGSWPAPFAVLGKALLPLRLSAFSSFDAVSVGTGLALAGGAALFTLRSRRVRAGRVAFGAAWLLILIAPTLLQRTGLYDYGEYRIYWLGFGPLLMGLEILRGLGAWGAPRAWIAAALALVCVAFAARSLSYQRVFDGPERFWTQMVEVDPGSGWGWFHVGRHHYSRAELPEALAAYRRAMEVGFERADLYVDLSATQLDLGDAGEAARAAERALALEPMHPHAQANLGAARLRLGDTDGALEALRGALDPRAEAHFEFAGPEQREAFRSQVHAAYRKLIRAHLREGRARRAREVAAELQQLGGKLPAPLARRIQRAAPASEGGGS